MADNTESWRIWTDNAIRFIPHDLTPEEDQALIAIAIAQTPVRTTLEIARRLLTRIVEEPDTVFLPVVWNDQVMLRGR